MRWGGHNFTCWPGAKSPHPRRVVVQRGPEVVGAEVWPQRFGHQHLGVRALPEEEVADPVLARCADDQVGIGQVRLVHARRDGRLVDAALRYSVLDQFAHRVDYLRPPPLIETMVEDAVLITRRASR